MGAEEGTYHAKKQNHMLEQIIDWKLIEAAKPALENAEKAYGEFDVVNTDRSIGTVLSHEVTKIYALVEMVCGSDDSHMKLLWFSWTVAGRLYVQRIHLELEGDANDYVGKGLSGGELTIYPSKRAPFVAEENIVVGNVCFYGATGGRAFIRGVAGERFCVRNSGVDAVVEGIGDHGCEYMTGGLVTVLGQTGINFGAGMSGGIAYVYDLDGTFGSKCNMEMIELEQISNPAEIEALHARVIEHQQRTGSTRAAQILEQWDEQVARFVKSNSE